MSKLHAGMLTEETCLLALEQTAGKGQRGRQWLVAPGMNITMSTVLHPPLYKPFFYSAAIALACYDFIKEHVTENVTIKWPNDIYIGDRKAAGILIEMSLRGNERQWAVTGTGINLNQQSFPPELNRAVSLKQVTGRHFHLITEAKNLHARICARSWWLNSTAPEVVLKEYNDKLYRRGQQVRLKKGSIVFSSVIAGVNDDGELITRDSIERSFGVGEVEFV